MKFLEEWGLDLLLNLILSTHVSDLSVLLDEHSCWDVPDTAGPTAVPELQQAGADHKVPPNLCQVD